MTFSQTIYKKDSKQKIRYLTVSANKGELIQESGILDSPNPVIHKKQCTGKNIGRSNETNIEEQAILEAKSKIKDKLDQGYTSSLDELENLKIILPILAKDYHEEKEKIDWNKSVYVQRKYDGQRCLANIKNGKVTLISRKGKVIDTVEHINKSLEQHFKNANITLDGELFCKELGGFQQQMKAIKKYRKGITDLICYHIYDIVDTQNKFEERYKTLKKLIKPTYSPLLLVETIEIKNEKELKKWHEQFISEQYEGTIIRHGDKPYEINKRSTNLLKYKDFKDDEGIIIDIIPGEVYTKQGTPILSWKNVTFECGVKMSHEEREELLINKKDYIGQRATFTYFELTEAGIPRFPIFKGVRND